MSKDITYTYEIKNNENVCTGDDYLFDNAIKINSMIEVCVTNKINS